MTIIEARERVAKGAALLDTHRPGWAQKIDCGKLNLSDGCTCILGQLEGEFWRGAFVFFNTDAIPLEPATVHGFHSGNTRCVCSGDSHSKACPSTATYALLQDAWI
jgi:hypothetical protein